MTSPFANPPSIPGAPSQVIGGGLQDYLPMILSALQASAQRKQRKAEEALQSIPEGATFSSLTPDQQKAYKKATGVKDLTPDTVVRPLPGTSDEATLGRLMKSLGIAPGSTLDVGLRASMAARTATGQAHGLTTPAGLEAETRTGQALATAGEAVAGARNTEAQAFKSATSKLANTGQGQNVQLTDAEIAAYKRFNDFVPSEAVAQQLTGQARGEVMKQALRVASDPNSATWATLLPEGVKPADVIGGVALGVGDIITSGANRRNVIEATAAQEAARALYGAAEAASKAMGGKYSPAFIAAVMQGNPKAINSEAGQMVSRFMDAGFISALTETAVKGDPGSIAVQRLLEVGRIPQIASNEQTLSTYSNLVRDITAATITRAHLGYDRPTEQGDAQKLWDRYNESIRKQMGGMFSSHWYQSGISVEQPKPTEKEQQQSQSQQDMQTVEQFLKATFGDTLPAFGAGQDRDPITGLPIPRRR